jgi:ABC-type enterochelin transport system permease subunit
MSIRSFLAVLFFALGLTAVLAVVTFLLSHAIYGDSLAPGAAPKIGAAGVIMLVVAHFLGRDVQYPFRIIIYYIVAFGGMRLAALPVRHRDFSAWVTVDYTLFLVGLSLFAGALLWAYSYRRARRSKSSAV